MIGDLITRGEQIQEMALSKDDHGRGKCQEFQPIRIFGTQWDINRAERDIEREHAHQQHPQSHQSHHR
jgi:hypothetical protein